MNEEILLSLRPDPLCEFRENWWRYALAGVIILGLAQYHSLKHGPSPTGVPPWMFALSFVVMMLALALMFRFLIARVWHAVLLRDRLEVNEPLKGRSRIVWADIKAAQVIRYGASRYVALTVEGRDSPVFMPLPANSAEVKAVLAAHVGPQNQLYKALSETTP